MASNGRQFWLSLLVCVAAFLLILAYGVYAVNQTAPKDSNTIYVTPEDPSPANTFPSDPRRAVNVI